MSGFQSTKTFLLKYMLENGVNLWSEIIYVITDLNGDEKELQRLTRKNLELKKY